MAPPNSNFWFRHCIYIYIYVTKMRGNKSPQVLSYLVKNDCFKRKKKDFIGIKSFLVVARICLWSSTIFLSSWGVVKLITCIKYTPFFLVIYGPCTHWCIVIIPPKNIHQFPLFPFFFPAILLVLINFL